MDISNILHTDGYAILPAAIESDAIDQMREIVCGNLDRMANTRPTPSARHCAGFHRIPELEPLHRAITSNAALAAALETYFAPAEFVSIGLSDITMNRSQPWHTDLLRGKYAQYLTPEMCWGDDGIGCMKALLYLQDGRSLKVIPGSHRRAVSLVDDRAVEPADPRSVRSVPVNPGDIVLMDIRLVHRGSTEEDMAAVDRAGAQKILISTVFGAEGAPLTQAMELGNTHRTSDWEAAHQA